MGKNEDHGRGTIPSTEIQGGKDKKIAKSHRLQKHETKWEITVQNMKKRV